MKGKYLKGKNIEYDGSQLRPLWALTQHDIHGDSVVFFRGPCNVKEEYMVDLADKKAGVSIYSPDMLHFIVEYFGLSMKEIVLVQRLLVTSFTETLVEFISDDAAVEREFDNIYGYPPGEERRGKLSVSVATVSPVSGLIHLGLNVRTEGTPVVTAGLEELGVEQIDGFALEAVKRFIEEIKKLDEDASKVRPVY